jgi:hypothetical protein
VREEVGGMWKRTWLTECLRRGLRNEKLRWQISRRIASAGDALQAFVVTVNMLQIKDIRLSFACLTPLDDAYTDGGDYQAGLQPARGLRAATFLKTWRASLDWVSSQSKHKRTVDIFLMDRQETRPSSFDGTSK